MMEKFVAAVKAAWARLARLWGGGGPSDPKTPK